jgi:predicted methyltransferase
VEESAVGTQQFQFALRGGAMKVALAIFFVLGSTARVGAETIPPGDSAAALLDAARPHDQIAPDAWRQPAALIAFAGIKPGDRIADFMPGNGYFTRLLSRVVGPQGRVYAYLPTQQLANCEPAETAGTLALKGDHRYSNVQILIAASDDFSPPEKLDMVWTAQNYHDFHDKFMNPTNVAKSNAAIFKALKPGGVFLVIDHAASPGSGLRDTETLHRIDPDTIRSEVSQAGFDFEAQSAVLRNPQDSHSLLVFDPAIRHKTDQVVFRFRKPDVGN